MIVVDARSPTCISPGAPHSLGQHPRRWMTGSEIDLLIGTDSKISRRPRIAYRWALALTVRPARPSALCAIATGTRWALLIGRAIHSEIAVGEHWRFRTISYARLEATDIRTCRRLRLRAGRNLQLLDPLVAIIRCTGGTNRKSDCQALLLGRNGIRRI